jgi:hypothetical protein
MHGTLADHAQRIRSDFFYDRYRPSLHGLKCTQRTGLLPVPVVPRPSRAHHHGPLLIPFKSALKVDRALLADRDEPAPRIVEVGSDRDDGIPLILRAHLPLVTARQRTREALGGSRRGFAHSNIPHEATSCRCRSLRRARVACGSRICRRPWRT